MPKFPEDCFHNTLKKDIVLSKNNEYYRWLVKSWNMILLNQ